jgi:hypothetical protein
VGFASGFAGPAVVGLMLERLGGTESADAWSAAFLVMALGSTVTAAAAWVARSDERSPARR